ncbi:MAG TPA: tRNA (cytidine(56)-2'-O)-methyltransferase [Candidatus Bilamarchaeaceae archaeon]|nr:tRNA (cytidine(56)-2'-O)-methyltransferase [Candidatus Bilamarchaeaceae archaeon]
MNSISVLRLGHRLPRDERITTHVALVARAFGAQEIIYTGQHDGSLEKSVSGIVQNWGGTFSIQYEKNAIAAIKTFKKNNFAIVHLTMYGIPLPEKIQPVQSRKNLLIIVGGEQVPREVYELADYNIAVTSQPHSEVAALAVFLNQLRQTKPLQREWDEQFKGKTKIEPSEKGKKLNS